MWDVKPYSTTTTTNQQNTRRCDDTVNCKLDANLLNSSTVFREYRSLSTLFPFLVILDADDVAELPVTRGASMPLRPAELRSLRYEPTPAEWPAVGRDAECDRIVAGLEQIMTLSIAENFNVPVDLNAFPIYAIVIAYPMDLSLIKARLENRFYRRVAALRYDARQIESNAKIFNDSRSAIVEYARVISELCLQFIRYALL